MNQHISRLDTNTDDSGQPLNHCVVPGLRFLLSVLMASRIVADPFWILCDITL